MRGAGQDGYVPLNSGAYSSRNLIANAQRCVNLIPELNPEETDPPAAVTHFARAGLTSLGPGVPAPGRGRGLFTATGNGQLYGVVGPNVYYIDPGWTYNLMGQIGNAMTPVSLADNGTTAVIVDGSPNGYQFTLATNAWLGQIGDPTGSFVGSVRADYVDTFLTFANPKSHEWLCSLSLQVAFNALQNGSAVSSSDPIVTHAVNLRQVWLLKEKNSEVWYLSGATPFPFEEWPNVFIPYGIAAAYSLVAADSNLFWLSRNKDGQMLAVMNDGYSAKAISTRALEYRWTNYATVRDCVGYTYQQSGHTIVVFHFPTMDEAWGYDLSTKQWHQRVSIDQNGELHREKISFAALVSDDHGYPNTNVGMDWATGQIYAIDQGAYLDNGMPIPCIRSFPHIVEGLNRLTIAALRLDLQTGTVPGIGEIDQNLRPWSDGWSNGFGPLIVQGSPRVAVRASRDGGGTWGNYRKKGMISAGRYRSVMRYRSWGEGRDWVFETSFPAYNVGLQGMYVDAIPHGA
jgi:hypothetical protein